MAIKAFLPIRPFVSNDSAAASLKPVPVGPVFDEDACARPIAAYDQNHVAATMPEAVSECEGPVMPPRPEGFKDDEYLFPSLTRNEYLRLTTFWYHTRKALTDPDLLANIQIKVDLVREFLDWDFAMCGFIDNNVFSRLVTSGIPTVVIPRRESTCSHTIQATELGTVFQVPDLSKDWRFRASPPVRKGGLRSYAGTTLRCQSQFGDQVALGSLCVASNKPDKTLNATQQATLVRFADMLTVEIIGKSHALRREEQQHMTELLSSATTLTDADQIELRVYEILRETYPNTRVSVSLIESQHVALASGQVVALSDFKTGVWEDSTTIETLIITQNHRTLSSDRSVRAIIGHLRTRPDARALVISSRDVRRVFDDVDVWFVESCAALLGHVAQERNLAEARLAKERFLRGITHQLRTPIHGVLGSVDLLAEELSSRNLLDGFNSPRRPSENGLIKHSVADNNPGVSTADILRTIQNSGRELMSTVNNILRINKWTELANSRRSTAIYDLSGIEETLLEDASTLLPENEVERLCVFFDNQLPANSTSVTINADLVRECLQPLLINAMQYTPRGCLVITCSCADDMSSLVFDVTDTGQGIRPENHARVFEEYEKEDAHSRGAGLGLTLASKIAVAMAGSVELVRSSPNQGSHFRLTFKEPQLGCHINLPESSRNPSKWESLDKFCVLPSATSSLVVRSFAQQLERRGLQRVSDCEDGLTVVAYSMDPSLFEEILAGVHLRSGISMCLLPAAVKASRLQRQYPNTVFFNGPFTTNRVSEIMSSIDRASGVKRNACHLGMSNESNEPLTMNVRPRYRGPPTALLVDDNIINLRIVKMYCERRSYPYRTAFDGHEALAQFKAALAQKAAVDFVILDLQMPNCDGIQACEEIRALEKAEGLRPAIIFMVTGQDSPKDKERSIEAGADEFHVKPMGIKALDQAIARHFESAQAHSPSSPRVTTNGLRKGFQATGGDDQNTTKSIGEWKT